MKHTFSGTLVLLWIQLSFWRVNGKTPECMKDKNNPRKKFLPWDEISRFLGVWPFLFVLPTVSLSNLTKFHDFKWHLSANDCQRYLQIWLSPKVHPISSVAFGLYPQFSLETLQWTLVWNTKYIGFLTLSFFDRDPEEETSYIVNKGWKKRILLLAVDLILQCPHQSHTTVCTSLSQCAFLCSWSCKAKNILSSFPCSSASGIIGSDMCKIWGCFSIKPPCTVVGGTLFFLQLYLQKFQCSDTSLINSHDSERGGRGSIC